MRVPEILACFEDGVDYTFKMIQGEVDIASTDEIVNVSESPIYRSTQFVDEFNGAPVVSIYGQQDTWSVEFPVSTYAVVEDGVVLLYGTKGTAEFTPQIKS